MKLLQPGSLKLEVVMMRYKFLINKLVQAIKLQSNAPMSAMTRDDITSLMLCTPELNLERFTNASFPLSASLVLQLDDVAQKNKRAFRSRLVLDKDSNQMILFVVLEHKELYAWDPLNKLLSLGTIETPIDSFAQGQLLLRYYKAAHAARNKEILNSGRGLAGLVALLHPQLHPSWFKGENGEEAILYHYHNSAWIYTHSHGVVWVPWNSEMPIPEREKVALKTIWPLQGYVKLKVPTFA